jgi:LmbE family N-acetylglucosaminyl deacetylase
MSEKTSDFFQNIDFKDAVIIAAHPDDEILWFSSIIKKVKQVIICYINQDSQPEWTTGRRRALGNYPLPNLITLALNLTGVFDLSDWQYPQTSSYGLDLDRGTGERKDYEENYRLLEHRLRELLGPYQHVFTHNPWGEYGHEEHVQLFRAAESLQAEMGFSLWIPNYVSNRSQVLMQESMTAIGDRFFTRPTDKTFAGQILQLYKDNNCWTWYEGYEWPDDETFFMVNPQNQRKRHLGKALPMNYIDVGQVGATSPLFKRTERIIQRISRIRNRFVKRKGR